MAFHCPNCDNLLEGRGKCGVCGYDPNFGGDGGFSFDGGRPSELVEISTMELDRVSEGDRVVVDFKTDTTGGERSTPETLSGEVIGRKRGLENDIHSITVSDGSTRYKIVKGGSVIEVRPDDRDGVVGFSAKPKVVREVVSDGGEYFSQQDRNDVLSTALETWGEEAQIDKTIEESGELITALSRYMLGRNDREDVVEEIADVRILLDQLSVLFGSGNVHRAEVEKLERLRSRLDSVGGSADGSSGGSAGGYPGVGSEDD